MTLHNSDRSTKPDGESDSEHLVAKQVANLSANSAQHNFLVFGQQVGESLDRIRGQEPSGSL